MCSWIRISRFIVKSPNLTVILIYRKKSSNEIDFAVSSNMAYGEVKLEPLGGGEGGVYEDPEEMGKSGQGNDGYSADNEYETTGPADSNKA